MSCPSHVLPDGWNDEFDFCAIVHRIRNRHLAIGEGNLHHEPPEGDGPAGPIIHPDLLPFNYPLLTRLRGLSSMSIPICSPIEPTPESFELIWSFERRSELTESVWVVWMDVLGRSAPVPLPVRCRIRLIPPLRISVQGYDRIPMKGDEGTRGVHGPCVGRDDHSSPTPDVVDHGVVTKKRSTHELEVRVHSSRFRKRLGSLDS